MHGPDLDPNAAIFLILESALFSADNTNSGFNFSNVEDIPILLDMLTSKNKYPDVNIIF